LSPQSRNQSPRFFPTPQKEKSANKYFKPKPTPPSAETSKCKQKTTKNDPKRRQIHPQISKTRLRRDNKKFQNATKRSTYGQHIDRKSGGQQKNKKSAADPKHQKIPKSVKIRPQTANIAQNTQDPKTPQPPPTAPKFINLRGRAKIRAQLRTSRSLRIGVPDALFFFYPKNL
jgi:hypothetical protein